MPWRATCPMDERMQFIAACLQGEESMSTRCRQFGISRKTGYKWLERYQAEGATGLRERSHAPQHQAQAVAASVAEAILALRAVHPYWGPRKLRAWLLQRRPGSWPAASTIGVLLQRAGLTISRRRRHGPTRVGAWTAPGEANQVWAADFKGWFRTGDGRRCDPLTISDVYSRYLLRCQGMVAPGGPLVRPLFEATFREYGLPEVIRTDNGLPFAAPTMTGLSRLAVWWIRLGIRPERIAPGHPEQNAEHERLHRTLKQETASPARGTPRAQQRAFDHFRQTYNHERPHEALGQSPPAARYRRSPRPYPDRLPPLAYPETYAVRRAHPNGEIKWRGRRVLISWCLAGESVGLEEIADGCWCVWFGPIELGWLDARRPERLHPRTTKPTLSPISSV